MILKKAVKKIRYILINGAVVVSIIMILVNRTKRKSD